MKRIIGGLITYIILNAFIACPVFASGQSPQQTEIEKEMIDQKARLKEQDQQERLKAQERLLRQLAVDATFNQALFKLSAASESEPREEGESLFSKLSQIIKISGSLKNSIIYDDNVFLKEDDEKGDMIYELRPAISIATTGAKNYLKLDYDYTSRWYIKSKFRTRNHGVKFETHIDRGVSGFTLADNYVRTQDVDVSGVGVDKLNVGRSRIDVNTVSFDTNYKFTEKKVFSAAFKNSTTKDFKDPTSDTLGRSIKLKMDNLSTGVTNASVNYGFSTVDYKAPDKDSDEHSAGLGLEYKLTPITWPFIKYGYKAVHYEKVTSNYHENNVNVGVGYKPSPINSTSIGYKYTTSQSKDPASNYITNSVTLGATHKSSPITDLDGNLSYGYRLYRDGGNDKDMAADIKFDHKLSDFTDMSLKYKYGVEGTVNTDYLRYYISLFSFNLKHKFVSSLTAELSATYERDLYRSRDLLTSAAVDDKTRDKYTIGLGLSYSLTRWASIGVNYTHSGVNSNFINESYRDNKYSCNFKLNF